jgi:hypothetical protein
MITTATIQQAWQALRAEGRLLAASLRDRRLAAVLAVFAALLTIVAQAPLDYAFDVGNETGYGSDGPMVADFHDPEHIKDTQQSFRWTTHRSSIRLPGVGRRALLVQIRLLPVAPEVAAHGAQAIELWANGQHLGNLPVRAATGGVYSFLVPPPPNGLGDHEIELRSDTYKSPQDQRSIGTPVAKVRVVSASWPSPPDWGDLLALLGAATLLWLALRRLALSPRAAQAALLAMVILASTAALLDPPRFGFGTDIALIVAALGWLLVVLLLAAPDGLVMAGLILLAPALALRLLDGSVDAAGWGGPGAVALGVAVALLVAGWARPLLGRLYGRVAPPLPGAARRWLLLFALIVFLTHFGGKIYPDSMWGDIGFHAHRLEDVTRGLVLLLSSNRGVDFPYPSAFYVLLAPLMLTGLDDRVLLRLVTALFDAFSPFLIYTIVARVLYRPAIGLTRRAWQVSVLAAGIYSFTAATLMTTWWNFSSHIFSQFAHLLLLTALVLLWHEPAADDRRPNRRGERATEAGGRWALLALFVLQLFVYLGHFGFWINMSLLGAISLAALLLGALRGRVGWGVLRFFLAGFVAAELFTVLFYYSAYTGMFLEQARVAAAGGLTTLANRAPVDRAILWRTLWQAGFQTHFGLFPVPLAICALALIWSASRDRLRRRAGRVGRGSALAVVTTFMAGTFAIGLFFAALPFLTGSTQATRWLMFSAWAVAVGAALVLSILWRRGRAARWLVVAMGIYVVWGTALMWVNALAWRIRPPEPF